MTYGDSTHADTRRAVVLNRAVISIITRSDGRQVDTAVRVTKIVGARVRVVTARRVRGPGACTVPADIVCRALCAVVTACTICGGRPKMRVAEGVADPARIVSLGRTVRDTSSIEQAIPDRRGVGAYTSAVTRIFGAIKAVIAGVWRTDALSCVAGVVVGAWVLVVAGNTRSTIVGVSGLAMLHTDSSKR